MITQEDVAKRAGVSFITVSRVINNKGNVKKETRERVLKIINELKYYPNSIGRALNSNCQNSIGIIAPVRIGTTMHDHIYYTEMMRGIESVCIENGFDMLISTQIDSCKKFDYLRLYYERKVDGLIIFTPDLKHPQMNEISKEQIPCVIIGDRTDHLKISYVDSDNEGGFYLMTKALIEKGHKRIAFVKGPDFNRNAEDRYSGFIKAMKYHKLKIDNDYIFNGCFDADSGVNALRHLLKLKSFPSAIMCANDFMAFGVMSEATKNRIRIPDDLSLVGFDGVDTAKYTNPPLTTVYQPVLKMGRKGAELILSMIKEKKYIFESKIFNVEYFENESVADIRKSSDKN